MFKLFYHEVQIPPLGKIFYKNTLIADSKSYRVDHSDALVCSLPFRDVGVAIQYRISMINQYHVLFDYYSMQKNLTVLVRLLQFHALLTLQIKCYYSCSIVHCIYSLQDNLPLKKRTDTWHYFISSA